MRDGAGYLSAGHAGQIVALDDSGNVVPLAHLAVSVRALAVVGDNIYCGDTDGMLHRITRSGERLNAFSAHRAAITGLAILADGCLASCGEDGAVRVWCGDVCFETAAAGDFVTSVAEGRAGGLVCASYDGGIYRLPLRRAVRPMSE